MKNRPVTTLFLLTSVDGKISTGASDELDVDRDYPTVPELAKGLHQYYEIEQTTACWSLNSGRVQAKLGANFKPFPEHRWNISFVLLDNHHLTSHGIEYFTHLLKDLVIVTSNPNHPAFSVQTDNLHILYYEHSDAQIMMQDLYQKFGCEQLTIQSGGTLNSIFLREKLLDYVDIVVAPVLVGGKDTSSLIDGDSLLHRNELGKLGVLHLKAVKVLKDSYLRLQYQVI